MTEEQAEEIRRAHGVVRDEGTRRGKFVGAERLHPTATATATATSARMSPERPMTTDGYYILECADLAEAIEWVKRIPTRCRSGSSES